MTLTRKRACFKPILATAFLALVVNNAGMSQPREASPAELIKFLTYQSERSGRQAFLTGLFTCGELNEDRTAAKSLVKFGLSAVPDLEKALDSVEKEGERSELSANAGWLLLSYARIRGPAAYPSLKRMAVMPNTAFLLNRIDNAIALSLSLTSYVSGSEMLVRRFHCRSDQPRDSMDQLVLAWLKGNQSWLLSSLGSNARAALDSLLQGRTWAEMRRQLWPGKSPRGVAVGYRFEIPGQLSLPEETLDETDAGPPNAALAESLDIDVLLRNGAGAACGSHRVKFVLTPVSTTRSSLSYLIDSSDLEGLLRLITSCAADAR